MRGSAETEDLLREAAPRVLAAVVRRFGDFGDSEDAVQEAMIAASEQWPAQGMPENPVGWLIHVASRRMTDRIRSETARRGREDTVAAERAEAEPLADHDDTLVLMFMCCHPALTPASAIALTLRAVAGLTTAEIGNAFLVPEATMAQRISRAKQNVKASSEQFRMPVEDERPERLRSVLRIVYLIFNEGYVTSSGPELARAELSAEAIRLARIVRLALPEDPEVAGLLALMLLTDSRRAARSGANGELIPLEEQDRTLWDRRAIGEGIALLGDAIGRRAVGEYQLQAAIAAEHAKAARVEDTDWREIAGLYGLLERMSGNPMVALNRAIAVAMVDGPEAGLTLLDDLDERLGGHHRLHATRAHLLEMAGDTDEAIAEYTAAASLTNSLPEQHYLTKQAARLNESRIAAFSEPASGQPGGMVEERDEKVLHEEEEAAAEEARRIGGRSGMEGMDEAKRASAEHGGGESEGFEEAEELLKEQASHGDSAGNPLRDAGKVEDEESPSVYGEADEIDSTEVEDDAEGS